MNAAKQLKVSLPSKQVMTNSEYHAHPATGSTSLKNVLRSPAHYLYEFKNPSEPTPAMALGTAIHEAILEPNLFMANAVVMPKFEGKGSREAKDQWLLEHHGSRILKEEDRECIKGVLGAISAHSTARGLLSSGAAEESYFWQDSETGIVCKCRPDFLRGGHTIIDVKSTIDAQPTTFPKAIANFSYHLSAAFYLEGVSQVIGQRFDEFIIIAVEKTAPYGVSVHLLDQGTIEAGRFLFRKALTVLKQCKDSDRYPAYPDRILTTALPNWAWPSEE